jgi:hypothetical protein
MRNNGLKTSKSGTTQSKQEARENMKLGKFGRKRRTSRNGSERETIIFCSLTMPLKGIRGGR